MSQFQILKNGVTTVAVDLDKFTARDDVNDYLRDGYNIDIIIEAENEEQAIHLSENPKIASDLNKQRNYRPDEEFTSAKPTPNSETNSLSKVAKTKEHSLFAEFVFATGLAVCAAFVVGVLNGQIIDAVMAGLVFGGVPVMLAKRFLLMSFVEYHGKVVAQYKELSEE